MGMEEGALRALRQLVAQASEHGQQRSRANSRAAATELGRRRVEREEVELFLAGRSAVRRVSRSAS